MSFSYTKLWKLLLDKELIKEDLRTGVQTTHKTIAKLGKNEYVSMRILDDICNFLDCNLDDIVEHKKDK